VFVSFDSGDIDLSRATGEGPRVLKRFLAFAETGVLDQPRVRPADFDSAFEEDVANVIASLGYLVDAQVGSAGFRIDLAVRDPYRPGRYILAVECDGATYHGALWARERDRLRQDVLEGLGWRFYRIWSTDWFHRREAEIDRLKRALDTALVAAPKSKPQPIPASNPPDPAPVVVAPLPATQSPPYRTADFPIRSSMEPHEVPVAQMAEIVRQIVEIEGPVHADEVGRRVATLFGKDRAGSRITASANQGLRHLRRAATVHEEEDFWFTTQQRDACEVRDRSLVIGSLQRAELLPPLEIRAAAKQAVKENGGISRDEMVVAIARLLGFQRTGSDLRDRVENVLARMVGDGPLHERGSLLRLAE
jgi:very-short-patch-repair endonuclease